MIGSISANITINTTSSVISAATGLFLTFASSLLTKGFNAAASTNDAKSNSNNPIILGAINKNAMARIINIIVFILKNLLNMQLISYLCSLYHNNLYICPNWRFMLSLLKTLRGGSCK